MKNILHVLFVLLFGLGAVLAPTQAAFAARIAQESTPMSGTVTEIIVNTDPVTGISTVDVTLVDANNISQTITLSLEGAAALGLVVVDHETGTVTVNQGAIGSDVSIEPGQILPPSEPTVGHPVAEAMADFFGLDYETIMGFHQDGAGFGVIAQACFMSFQLAGDASLCGDILDAKKNGDFSSIILPDGTAASNWGQLVKTVIALKNPKNNLGGIMSGHANSPGEVQLKGKSNGANASEKVTGKPDDKAKNEKAPGKGSHPKNKDKGKGNNNK